MSHLSSLEDRQRSGSRTPQATSHQYPAILRNTTPSALVGGKSNAPPWSTSGIPPWSTATRPLSDIRELTEPSLTEIAKRAPSVRRNHSRASTRSHASEAISARKGSAGNDRPPAALEGEEHRGRRGRDGSPTTADNRSSHSSLYSIPPGNIPTRSSSKPARQGSTSRRNGPPIPAAPPRGLGYTITNHGPSRSPVKQGAARTDPAPNEDHGPCTSRTFARTPLSTDILDAPCHRHPRVAAELHVSASLFVGGGSIEGHIRMNVDDAERIRHKRAIALGRISLDLLGVEEITGPRRSVFLNLATELIDAEHPPPLALVEWIQQISPIDPFWLLAPSIASIPFMLSLPLDVGPPPFQSKNARIRYVLCATLLVREQGRHYLVRSSQDLSILSVYDPEKALTSLPSPLTASDEYVRQRDRGDEIVRVTAGLHRQVWVNGTSIFVDVHIANHSNKDIKRVELQLERNILCYKHTAAATLERSASQARIFDSNERSILNKVVHKQGAHHWSGVPAHSTDIRTYDLDLPRGHATVKCGKYFEVRYFLNITISSSHTKLVTVQLPIVLIHMNSLDVIPNSVAQVAAAIEDKRAVTAQQSMRPEGDQPPRPGIDSRVSRRPSTSVQGRAFAAPRLQSTERRRVEADEIENLGRLLDATPRRYAADSAAPSPAPDLRHHVRRVGGSFEYHTPPSNRKGRILLDNEHAEIRDRLRHTTSLDSVRTGTSSVRRQRRGQPPSGPSSKATGRQDARGGKSGARGFRHAEFDGEPELGLGLRQSTSVAGNHRARLDSVRARNFQFPALGRSRSRSREKWAGLMRFVRGKDDEEDKENWI